MSNADQTTHFGDYKVYPIDIGRDHESAGSWTGDTAVSSAVNGDYDMSELPRRTLSSESTASVHSVMTEHYLDQIKDREKRESARRNIDYLRELGFHVQGRLVDGKYFVKFSTPVKTEVMSLKSFLKARIRSVLQQ